MGAPMDVLIAVSVGLGLTVLLLLFVCYLNGSLLRENRQRHPNQQPAAAAGGGGSASGAAGAMICSPYVCALRPCPCAWRPGCGFKNAPLNLISSFLGVCLQLSSSASI
ncbi:hypothetical protein PVAP13_9NG462100 [Panicum virgatum]|uniref:Uncharacterized protein n=1 Tax=Panicum virgatum TaxID=38727 RepID=A0A8T0MWB3_PANVG|nr:hypothetical protein PVAP13_9NG462100 [Panicum virgatum]